MRGIGLAAALLIAMPASARSPELSLPSAAAVPTSKAGIQKLGDHAFFYRPANPSTGRRPLLVMLHGAGQSARAMLDVARPEAERCGCLLLAVQSKGATWDTIGLVRQAAKGGRTTVDRLFGEDTNRMEQALGAALRAADADHRSVVLVGFSDGASYALSLGLANPSLFRGVVAIAPGFHLEPAAINPRQRLFIAHSPTDRVLGFERTRDGIVAPLRRAGFDLRFRPFDGGHRIDRLVLAEGVDFVLGQSAGRR